MSTAMFPAHDFGRRALAPTLRLALVIGLLLGALQLATGTARAATFSVIVTTTADTNNACATSGTGTCSLRDAVRFANARATTDTTVIGLGPGIYTLTQPGTNEDNALTGDLDIRRNVTFDGAGRDQAIISGNSTDRILDIFPGASVAIGGVTIRTGAAAVGGGIRNAGALTIADSRVRDNVAIGNGIVNAFGGGLFNTGTVAGNNVSFSVNRAQDFFTLPGIGGAIGQSGGGALTLTNSSISENVAFGIGSFGGAGGGIAHFGSGPLSLVDSSVIANTAAAAPNNTSGGDGGGIYHADTGQLTLTRVRVEGNRANGGTGGTGGVGGGIRNGGPLAVTGSRFFDNIAFGGGTGGGEGGAIFHTNASALTIVGSTLNGNRAHNAPTAPGLGGAIYNQGTGPNTVVNATFVSNTGGTDARAIFNDTGGQLSIAHATIGESVIGLSAQNGGLTVANSIVTGSTTNPNCAGQIADGGHNLDNGTTCGFGTTGGSLSNADPRLGPFQNFPGSILAGFIPLADSPAIDRVPTSGSGCPATDAAGRPRPQGAGCETGAVEVVPPTPTFTVAVSTNGPGAVAGTPGVYPAGSTATFAASPGAGALLLGWRVDGHFVGFGSQIDLPMTRDRVVRADFAPTPAFPDVSPATPGYEAIGQLAARGVIRGYTNGNFGPGDTVLRAQMAALIARAMGWDAEDHGNPFVDRGGLDPNLWRNVGTLAHYGVAKGYDAAHFGPNDQVTRAQTVSFIARAMVAGGYWQQQPDNPALHPDVPASSGHRGDIATFVHYAGALPNVPQGQPFASWNQPATRGWFARALWQAYGSYFSVNRIP